MVLYLAYKWACYAIHFKSKRVGVDNNLFGLRLISPNMYMYKRCRLSRMNMVALFVSNAIYITQTNQNIVNV